MSLLGATILTAIATSVFAVGTIVTAVLAYLAFRKQSREVAAIERQVADQKELPPSRQPCSAFSLNN